MKESFFKKKGIYYRMNDFRAERQTLVFVHGLSSSSSAWKKYEEKFECEYNILTFDLRGHGKSIKFKKYSDYKIEYLADDLFELTKYLNLPKFFIIGHSFGALVALEYISRHQDTLSGIILLSPSSNVNQGILSKTLRLVLVVSKIFDILPMISKTSGHIDYSDFKNTGDWNMRRLFTDIHNTTLRVYLYCTRQSYKVNYDEILEHIFLPTLIIHGKNDTIFPIRNSQSMTKKIRNSELFVIDNTDHIIVLNNFPEICSKIEKFIKKNNNNLAV